MKRILLTCLTFILFGSALLAQPGSLGMNYQAVARDAAGNPIANMPVYMRISLGTKGDAARVHYSEVHQVVTDELGLFNIVIGRGESAIGAMAEVPWAEDRIWLDVEMAGTANDNFQLVSSAQLLSVPYAFHALTANRLAGPEIELRNQSIYWTTSGNSKTRPPVHFLGTRDNEDLVLKTNGVTRTVLTKDGQLQIYAGNTGPMMNPDQEKKETYPLTVEGSTQGIYVQVQGLAIGEANNDNNFVTFADGQGIKGRIEGQTLAELLADPQFLIDQALFLLDLASLGAEIVAFAAEAAGLAASGVGAGAAIGAAANGVAAGIHAAALAIEYANWLDDLFNSVGVTYESGGADYAEWLPRAAGVRDLSFGEVVGVKAGQISLQTKDADHYMVISMNPIVLGNAPQPDQMDQFEKVAFMGQVPVKVVGPVKKGDYILPSGNHDGLAIAVSPAEMKTGDYRRIIGVSWEEAQGAPVNFVNVAVGINANDLSRKVAELSARVDNIMNYLEGKEALKTDDGLLAVLDTREQPTTQMTKLYTDEEFDRLLEQNSLYVEATFDQAKEVLIERGYDLEAYPHVLEMLNDPVPFLKELRRDPNFITQWAQIDQNFKSRN